MQHKFLILEDKVDHLQMLEKLILEVDASIRVYAVSTVEEAYRIAVEHNIDGFFVDIVLDPSKKGDASGIRFVKEIRDMRKYITTPVIFITSIEDPDYFAYRELKCFDYLEKPFDSIRLKQNIEKILQIPVAEEKDRILPFHRDGILYPISCKDIKYIISKHHLLDIHLADGTVFEAQYRPVKMILEDADYSAFFQCSKSTIVNRSFVYNLDVANRYLVMKDSDERVSIGVTFKNTVKELFNGT